MFCFCLLLVGLGCKKIPVKDAALIQRILKLNIIKFKWQDLREIRSRLEIFSNTSV